MDEKEIIKLAAEAGAAAALNYIEQHRRKEVKSRHDKRLRNTKLLLKNYNLLKDHSKNSVYSMQQLTENAIDVLDTLDGCDSNTYIDSIKRSMARTCIIIAHIDEMLDLYQCYCQRSDKDEDGRRYRILRAYYFEDRKMEDIAAQEKVDERTFYRDIREACIKLGSLIFGIDGLDDVSKSCQ